MDFAKPFYVELILKQNKKIGGKKLKIVANLTKEEVYTHLIEFLSPYQRSLLQQEIRHDEIDFGHLITEICKHNSQYSVKINKFDYNAIRVANIEPAEKERFVSYLKLVLKM